MVKSLSGRQQSILRIIERTPVSHKATLVVSITEGVLHSEGLIEKSPKRLPSRPRRFGESTGSLASRCELQIDPYHVPCRIDVPVNVERRAEGATSRTLAHAPDVFLCIAPHRQELRVTESTYLACVVLRDQRHSRSVDPLESMSETFLGHRSVTEPCVAGVGCAEGDQYLALATRDCAALLVERLVDRDVRF